jgi:hypothetical protein
VVVAKRVAAGAGESWDIEPLRAGAKEGRVSEQSSVFEELHIWNVVGEFRAELKGECLKIRSDNVGAKYTMSRGCMMKNCLYLNSLGVWRVCWQWGIGLCTIFETASLQREQLACHEIQIMGIASEGQRCLPSCGTG